MATVWTRILVSFSLASASAGYVLAQTTQGGIVGTIRDEKGAYIAGADVTVTSRTTGLQRETKTADNGIFRLLALPTGSRR